MENNVNSERLALSSSSNSVETLHSGRNSTISPQLSSSQHVATPDKKPHTNFFLRLGEKFLKTTSDNETGEDDVDNVFQFFESHGYSNNHTIQEVKLLLQDLLKHKKKREKLFEKQDKLGQNILHLCIQNFPEIVSAKIDLNKKDNYGNTPLSIAARLGREDLFLELLNGGSKPDIQALCHVCGYFCSNQCDMVISAMISKGVDVNEQLSNGDTALHWAVGNKRENLVEGSTGSLLMIQILLSKNANPNKKNKRGATPLEWAINTENVESTRFLLSAGASFDPAVLTVVSRTSFSSSSGSNSSAVRDLCLLFLETQSVLRKNTDLTEAEIDNLVKKLVKNRFDFVGVEKLNQPMLQSFDIKNTTVIQKFLNVQQKIYNQYREKLEEFQPKHSPISPSPSIITTLNSTKEITLQDSNSSSSSSVSSIIGSSSSGGGGGGSGSFLKSDFALEGDALIDKITLRIGDTFVGKKNLRSMYKDGHISRKHFQFHTTAKGTVTCRLLKKSKKNAYVIRSNGEKVIFQQQEEEESLVEVGEEDRIFFNESVPSVRLVVDNMQIKRQRSTAAAFPVEDWLDRVKKTFKKQKETPETSDEEKQHLKRLEFRLGQYKLKRRNIMERGTSGDSLFEAVADQLVDILQDPSDFRKAAANWLLLHSTTFKLTSGRNIGSFNPYPDLSWEDYCKQLLQGILPGDALCLVALSNEYQFSFTLFTSDAGLSFLVDYQPKVTQFPTTGPSSSSSNFITEDESPSRVLRKSPTLTLKSLLLSQRQGYLFDSLGPVIEVAKVSDYNIDPTEVQIHDVIGRGSSGEVYLADWKGTLVCAKHILPNFIRGKKKDAFLAEAAILMKLRHPRIVLFMGIVDISSRLYIITEFMERGSLRELLAMKHHLSWRLILRMTKDISEGLLFLHQSSIVHRDLKTANILCDRDFNLKLADFGVAKYTTDEVHRTMSGTVAWTAPEVLAGESYSPKADVYSFAIVVWSLVTGQEPHSGLNDLQIMNGLVRHDLRPTIPDSCLTPVSSLIQDCWDKSLDKRPDFTLVLSLLSKINISEAMDKPLQTDALKEELSRLKGELEKEKQIRESLENDLSKELQHHHHHNHQSNNKKRTPIQRTLSTLDATPHVDFREKTGTLQEELHKLWKKQQSLLDLIQSTKSQHATSEEKKATLNQLKESLTKVQFRINQIWKQLNDAEDQVAQEETSSSDNKHITTTTTTPISTPTVTIAAPTQDKIVTTSQNSEENTETEKKPTPRKMVPISAKKRPPKQPEDISNNNTPTPPVIISSSPSTFHTTTTTTTTTNNVIVPNPLAMSGNHKTQLPTHRLIDFKELEFDIEKDEIGQGNSATVYKGKYRGQQVAIKILNLKPQPEEFEKELVILSSVQCPGVVYFFGACVDPQPCLVTEFMSQGSLLDIMQRPNFKWTWGKLLKFAEDVFETLNALHNWVPTIVHRDIKSQNLLVDDRNYVKVADLGLARFTTFDNRETLFKARGSLAYMAPEVWENASSKSGQGFTTKSDIYSMAVVLWEMIWRCTTGSWRIPFPDLHPYVIITEVVENGKRPETNSKMPTDLISLMQSCWDASPDKRPSCSQVLQELKRIQSEYKENKDLWAQKYAVQNPKL